MRLSPESQISLQQAVSIITETYASNFATQLSKMLNNKENKEYAKFNSAHVMRMQLGDVLDFVRSLGSF